MATEDKDIAIGSASAKFLADGLHYVVIEIGDTHAVARAAIAQARVDAGVQQASNR
jgi:hypothetical protein